MKKQHPTRRRNWLHLSSNFRRAFGSVPTSFTGSATAEMRAIVTIGLKPNRK